MPANTSILIGTSYNSSTFALGEEIDGYVELLPKITTKQRTTLGKTLQLDSAGFKVYDTTKKIRYSWTGLDWQPQNETLASGLTVNTELSPTVVDTSHSLPPTPGQVLTATSTTTAKWLNPTGSATGDLFFPYTQIIAADIWVIVHGLGKYPSVTVVDSAGTVVTGDITYNSINQVTLTFSGAFSGKAYLN